jgi:hypothetical protein
MGFNADAFLAAREPWTLTIGGRTYAARPVSVAQVLQFQKDVDGAGGDPARVTAAMTALLRAMFPPRWAYVVGRDPVRAILALDTGAQSEVLRDFFEYLARTMNRTTGTTKIPPSPPSSVPTPTPAPSEATEAMVAPV